MPNYVEGNLKITGGKEELKRFKEFAFTKNKKYEMDEKDEGEDNVLDTDKFIPYPEEFKEKDRLSKKFYDLKRKQNKGELTEEENRELILMSLEQKKYEKDGFNSGGHSWCINNWGTKWGICNPELDDGGKDLFYSFDTAWSPCSPVVLKMSELFPKLEFNYKYWEGGSGFRGILIYKNNKTLKDKTYEFKGNRGG